MKRLGVLPLSPGCDANPSQGYRPSISSGFPNNSPHPFILLGGEGQYPFILLGGERDTVKVNHFTQEHNRMTQLGLEPRPPRPGVHCTNHYATATRGPLPHSPPRLCNILMTPKSIFFIPLLGLVSNNWSPSIPLENNVMPRNPPPPTPTGDKQWLVPSLLMLELFRLLFLYIRFIVSSRTKTSSRDKVIFQYDSFYHGSPSLVTFNIDHEFSAVSLLQRGPARNLSWVKWEGSWTI